MLAAVVFALFARTFLFQAFEVPSPSMEKNVLTGDRLLVNKFVFASRLGPARGQRCPNAPSGAETSWSSGFRTTLAAISSSASSGFPARPSRSGTSASSIDGRLLDEPYAFHADDTVWPDEPSIAPDHRRRDQLPPTRVQAGQYFVMGDNRDDSNDSRYWGAVPAGHIEGRALFVYWSFLPRASDAPAGLRALARFPLEAVRRTRWDRLFQPVR